MTIMVMVMNNFGEVRQSFGASFDLKYLLMRLLLGLNTITFEKAVPGTKYISFPILLEKRYEMIF